MNVNNDFIVRFSMVLRGMFAEGELPEKIAVAVSGGADSMALVHSLAAYVPPEVEIFALTVDHCLREEAACEAVFVGEAIASLDNVSHNVLVWEEGRVQSSKIEEAARDARYALMFDFMSERGISHLFLAHHQNDQAETFLFRLAKGSGVDGLACMPYLGRACHKKREFVLCRPFLGESKADILEYVKLFDIPYIDDPSNKDEQFARVRLRKSVEVLSDEGLTPERLCKTAKRMERAREVIEYVLEEQYEKLVKDRQADFIIFDGQALGRAGFPMEIVIRIILKAMVELNGGQSGYGPRLLRVEKLCEDLVAGTAFRKRTLNGIIFERRDKAGDVVLMREEKLT